MSDSICFNCFLVFMIFFKLNFRIEPVFGFAIAGDYMNINSFFLP